MRFALLLLPIKLIHWGLSSLSFQGAHRGRAVVSTSQIKSLGKILQKQTVFASSLELDEKKQSFLHIIIRAPPNLEISLCISNHHNLFQHYPRKLRSAQELFSLILVVSLNYEGQISNIISQQENKRSTKISGAFAGTHKRA